MQGRDVFGGQVGQREHRHRDAPGQGAGALLQPEHAFLVQFDRRQLAPGQGLVVVVVDRELADNASVHGSRFIGPVAPGLRPPVRLSPIPVVSLPPSTPATAPALPALPVLHRDADLLAVDKPAGLLVHASRLDAHAATNAVDLLRAAHGEPQLAPLHRLDKATSGVLLLARHPDAARRLGAAFMAGEVRKGYLALVRGWPAPHGETAQPLARDPELPSAGQPLLEACTRWRRLACFEWPFQVDARHPRSRYALVAVEPLTGRRHQIRRHFKQLAHPLVGDSTHGKGAHNRAVAAWLGVQRLWLHAAWVELPGGLRIVAPPGPAWDPLCAAADAAACAAALSGPMPAARSAA